VTSRELVLTCLSGGPVPRPPVIAPGGMMSFAVTEAMDACGAAWPGAHCDIAQMVRLALEMQRATGMDNIGLPFCMTVEAEALGAAVDFGTRTIQPWVDAEPITQIEEVTAWLQSPSTGEDRRPLVLEAIRQAREAAPDVAVVGSVVGPVSLAGQLLEAGLLLRAMRRQPKLVHDLLAAAEFFVRRFAVEQVQAGADVIMAAEPTATGEILGPSLYADFADPYLRRLIDALRGVGAPVILHVCGRPSAILPALAHLPVQAVSLDETADLREARAALPHTRLMGNLSSIVLEQGPPEHIAEVVRQVLEWGVDIVAPACGVTATTPLAHLQAMVAAAHEPPEGDAQCRR
jgi:MtaA/CmuA family methyltransferase